MTRTPTAKEMAEYRAGIARSAANARDFLFHTYMSQLAAAAFQQNDTAFKQYKADLRELFDGMNERLCTLDSRG